MLSRDALIAGYACTRPGCLAKRREPCKRKNGNPRTQQHLERWKAAGVTADELRRYAYERRP